MRYIYTFFSVIDISLVFYNILFCEYSDNVWSVCTFTSPIIRDYAPFTVTVLRYTTMLCTLWRMAKHETNTTKKYNNTPLTSATKTRAVKNTSHLYFRLMTDVVYSCPQCGTLPQYLDSLGFSLTTRSIEDNLYNTPVSQTSVVYTLYGCTLIFSTHNIRTIQLHANYYDCLMTYTLITLVGRVFAKLQVSYTPLSIPFVSVFLFFFIPATTVRQ